MLAWIASYPRSGNTLTSRTLADVYGINRFWSIYNEHLFMKGWRGRGFEPPENLDRLPHDELLEALRERPEPYFVKSHRLEDSSDRAAALYCLRDGRDVQVSCAHWVAGPVASESARWGRNSASSLKRLPFEERLSVLVGSKDWSRHVRAWRTRSAPTALVRFEDLVEDPAATVKRACDALGIELPEPSGRLPSFAKLHERDPVKHRRGEIGTWRDEMPAEIERRFWHVHGKEMVALGYREGEPVRS